MVLIPEILKIYDSGEKCTSNINIRIWSPNKFQQIANKYTS